MKRPKIHIENYQAVYDWYRTYQQPRPIAKLAYAGLNRYFKPVVHLMDGVADELSDLRHSDTPQILVLNHPTNHSDQYVASAVLHQIMPHAVGRTRVLAKNELFRGAKLPFINIMGAIPTFRKKDHMKDAESYLDDEERHQHMLTQSNLVDDANEYMMQTVGSIVASGQSLGVFGEGTHNKTDPYILQKLRPGFARIALYSALEGTSPVITPIAMSYGQTIDSLNPKKATIVVMPSRSVTTMDSIDNIVDDTRVSLQTALTQAHEINIASNTPV